MTLESAPVEALIYHAHEVLWFQIVRWPDHGAMLSRNLWPGMEGDKRDVATYIIIVNTAAVVSRAQLVTDLKGRKIWASLSLLVHIFAVLISHVTIVWFGTGSISQ